MQYPFGINALNARWLGWCCRSWAIESTRVQLYIYRVLKRKSIHILRAGGIDQNKKFQLIWVLRLISSKMQVVFLFESFVCVFFLLEMICQIWQIWFLLHSLYSFVYCVRDNTINKKKRTKYLNRKIVYIFEVIDCRTRVIDLFLVLINAICSENMWCLFKHSVYIIDTLIVWNICLKYETHPIFPMAGIYDC